MTRTRIAPMAMMSLAVVSHVYVNNKGGQPCIIHLHTHILYLALATYIFFILTFLKKLF